MKTAMRAFLVTLMVLFLVGTAAAGQRKLDFNYADQKEWCFCGPATAQMMLSEIQASVIPDQYVFWGLYHGHSLDVHLGVGPIGMVKGLNAYVPDPYPVYGVVEAEYVLHASASFSGVNDALRDGLGAAAATRGLAPPEAPPSAEGVAASPVVSAPSADSMSGCCLCFREVISWRRFPMREFVSSNRDDRTEMFSLTSSSVV